MRRKILIPLPPKQSRPNLLGGPRVRSKHDSRCTQSWSSLNPKCRSGTTTRSIVKRKPNASKRNLSFSVRRVSSDTHVADRCATPRCGGKENAHKKAREAIKAAHSDISGSISSGYIVTHITPRRHAPRRPDSLYPRCHHRGFRDRIPTHLRGQPLTPLLSAINAHCDRTASVFSKPPRNPD